MWASCLLRANKPPRLPWLADERVISGCFSLSMLAIMSIVKSWLPMATTVPSISPKGLSRLISTSVPPVIPSLP